MDYPVISADPHITEHPSTYIDHIDSTWPWSQQVIKEQTAHLSDEQKRSILCDNVADLYQIDLAPLAAAA